MKFKFRAKSLTPKAIKPPKIVSVVKSVGLNWLPNRKIYTKVVLVIALPTALGSLSASLVADPAWSAYTSFGAIILNCVLVWVALSIAEGNKPSLRQAYYLGTSRLVAFMVVTFWLAVCLLPLLAASLVLSEGLAVAVSTGEMLLLSLAALLLALPSLLLLSRSLFGLFIVQQPDKTPMKALRQSWRSTKGRTWALGGKLVQLIIVSIAVMAIPTVVLVFIAQKTNSPFWLGLLQLLGAVIILPLAAIYLHKLYEHGK